MPLISFSDSSKIKATIDKESGFLTAPVTLARVGVQHYFGYEIGLTDERSLDKIGVYRPATEVFHDDSIASFINLVVTDDHPIDFVNTENVKNLQVGSVSNVTPSADTKIDGIVTITDKTEIDKIKDGKNEVSVGYSNELKKEKGTFDGIEYEFVQTKIRANHLAIVDAGRCGAACKLTLDHKKEKKIMTKITIDGMSFDVENDQLAQAIQNRQAAHDAEIEKFKKKGKEDEEEIKKEKAEKDKAEAAKDAAEAKVLDDKALGILVKDRAELLATASTILGDKMIEDCNDCPRELKSAVIDEVMGDKDRSGNVRDLSARSMDYIDALFDAAVEKAKAAKKTTDNLSQEMKDEDGKAVTRKSIRDAYIAGQKSQANGGA